MKNQRIRFRLVREESIDRPGKFFKTMLVGTFAVVALGACKKEGSPAPPPVTPGKFGVVSIAVNGSGNGTNFIGVNAAPQIKFTFDAPLSRSTVMQGISFKDKAGIAVAFSQVFSNGDSVVVIQPSSPLNYLKGYNVGTTTFLKSKDSSTLRANSSVYVQTGIDSSDKFPRLSDSALLDLVQQRTLKYFYDFGHPISGLARERDNSGDLVTTGGSGMGIMAMLAGIHRNFINRADGLGRIQKISNFLLHTAQSYHGAFPHWLNGATGATIPFSANDNGADLVETSFLMAGLLSARQFFDGAGVEETALRDSINKIWNNVEWDWFRQNNQNVLYWHWSPDKGWIMNFKIQGWNECLITYVLAASSTTHTIPKAVYDEGWAGNGAIKNGNPYYGVQLPLGQPYGGPLFLAHYSFLGIDPQGLSDAYANYWTQNTSHTLINHNYCKANPKLYYGYSDSCWGLTASDNQSGYSAHSPSNDLGVISPTAAISSLPYTPAESMAALRFFYYKLGDRIWRDYGFTDAFNLNEPWIASSFLAIDQGPIVVMIENYRSGLLWNLLMSCPEVKSGLLKLGFSGPHL